MPAKSCHGCASSFSDNDDARTTLTPRGGETWIALVGCSVPVGRAKTEAKPEAKLPHYCTAWNIKKACRDCKHFTAGMTPEDLLGPIMAAAANQTTGDVLLMLPDVGVMIPTDS